MNQALPYFRPGVNAILIGVGLAVFIGANVWLITDRHHARRIAQAACAAQARAEVARKPILATTVRLADECLTLRRGRGEAP
mgnify:FL=1